MTETWAFFHPCHNPSTKLLGQPTPINLLGFPRSLGHRALEGTDNFLTSDIWIASRLLEHARETMWWTQPTVTDVDFLLSALTETLRSSFV